MPMTDAATIRVMAICGSLQKESSNLALLRAATAMAPADVDVALYDGIRHLPAFDPDVQAAGNPPVVVDFIEQLKTSHGLLIACPEYAHGMPGSLKNALDWLVGSHYLGGIPVAVTASVPHEARGRLGLESLTHIIGVIGAHVVWDSAVVRGESADDSLRELLAALILAGRRFAESDAAG